MINALLDGGRVTRTRAHAMRPYHEGVDDRVMVDRTRATRTGGRSKQRPYDDGGDGPIRTAGTP